ncbi:AhpC/TSA family protein [Arcicella aurantiaca]|uniref:AhpC/TSA family protein n=1 Tax=Arcicella aurantiaca TaxID=591202 RepID=A0A316ECF2_9BACT|nr:redoxin domain-containing protein [Arcicella aurantiaca]PWK27626.1 AhpC/TSA family protein [Arcicella aurantiaca]
MNPYNNIFTLNWDRILPITIFKGKNLQFNPIKVGAVINNLIFNQTKQICKINLETLDKTPSLKKIQGNKPLTISFLSEGWNQYGLNHLNTLSECYQEISSLGGNLLVIVQAGHQEVTQMARYFNLPFTLIADPTNQIAKQLGTYSEENAVWDRIAGITEDVPIPATYVIDKKGRVIYHSIDEHFTKPFSPSEMLGAVFSAAHNIPYSIHYQVAA